MAEEKPAGAAPAETITTNKTNRTMSYNRIDSLLGTTGKLTPQAVEFEEAVLGALMIDDNAVTEVLSVVLSEGSVPQDAADAQKQAVSNKLTAFLTARFL